MNSNHKKIINLAIFFSVLYSYPGCDDATACNYDSNSTTDTDNSLCTYTDGICETCVDLTVIDNDLDDDGVCDADEVLGCTDETACKYESNTTTDTENSIFNTDTQDTSVNTTFRDKYKLSKTLNIKPSSRLRKFYIGIEFL